MWDERYFQCDHICGPGKQTRVVTCYRKTDGKIQVLEDEACETEVPEREKDCELRPCAGLDWITSEWSGVSLIMFYAIKILFERSRTEWNVNVTCFRDSARRSAISRRKREQRSALLRTVRFIRTTCATRTRSQSSNGYATNRRTATSSGSLRSGAR